MEEVRADTSLWADMDTIRRAHLAETNALENVVTALASKYFSSISALQRQVEAITEWQSEVEERFHSGESRRHNGVVDGEEKTEECSNDALDAGDCQAPSDSKHIQVGKARIRCSGQETLNGQHEKGTSKVVRWLTAGITVSEFLSDLLEHSCSKAYVFGENPKRLAERYSRAFDVPNVYACFGATPYPTIYRRLCSSKIF